MTRGGYRTSLLCLLALVLGAAASARAQTITLDRVVATVNGVPLTAGDVTRECAVEALLNGRTGTQDPSPAERSAALARLIDQKLLARELRNYRFDKKAESSRAEKQMAEISRRFKSERALVQALRSVGLNESQLLNRVEEQDEILEMIDRRLRPAAVVSPKDVADYYQEKFLPAYAHEHGGAPPPLAATESRIREILTQKKINALLENWLAELRKENNVRILENDPADS